MPELTSITELAALVAEARGLSDYCIELLAGLTALESPSADPERLAAVAERLRGELERRGALVERHPAPGYGEQLLARVSGAASGGRPLLVVGHMDTVHAAGTLARLPFAVERGVVRGPGVYDMKAGLAVAITSLDLLSRVGRRPAGDLLFVITCDEEIGSPASRSVLQDRARDARGALVLEPCVPGGAAKTRRKGVGGFELRVRGRAAHAGIDPEAGASAIHELVGLLREAGRLADPERGITVNVGVIRGGTRPNVVAEHAHAEIDFRFWPSAEARRVEEGVRALTVSDPGCTLWVAGGVDRGPLEQTEASARLFDSAHEIAAAQGWELAEGSTGGASDGNLTSAMGCPTLDGLGPDGGGAHSLEEYVRRPDIAPRIALLAGLFMRL